MRGKTEDPNVAGSSPVPRTFPEKCTKWGLDVGVEDRSTGSMFSKLRAQKSDMRESARGTISLYHGWAGPELPPVKALIKKFEMRHPGVTVNVTELPWETLRVEVSATIEYSPPDIFPREVGPELSEFAEAGRLADITDVWRKERFYDAFPYWMVEKCALGRSMVAVPVKIYTFAVWYLEDVFRKYRVEPPETWDEFIDVCKTLKKRGIAPIVASSWGNSIWFNHLLLGVAGANFYQRLIEGSERWSDEKVVDTYELLRELVRDFFLPHPLAHDFPTAWMKLNNREAAMILQGDWLNGMWQHEYRYTPGKQYNFFLLPPAREEVGRTMVVGGNVWVAPKKARNLKDAKKFLGYAGSLEAHRIMARKGMGIMAHKEVPEAVYDPMLVRLRRELFSRRTAFALPVMLSQKVMDAEEGIRKKVILEKRVGRWEIRELLEEMDERI